MDTTKRHTGFALASPAVRQLLGRRGGIAATKRHRYTHEEAVEAGRKGGEARAARRRLHAAQLLAGGVKPNEVDVPLPFEAA